jgi:uncharacterized protein (TIGR03435 family)
MVGRKFRLVLHNASRGLGVKFLKAAILLLVVQSCLAQSVPSMAADADPSFEVATIKPSQPDEQRSVVVQGTRLVTADTSLVDLMMFAYSVHSLQIMDGPEWLKTEKFDVVVQPNLPGRPSSAQMRSIIQKLLADRFKLVFHHAQRELPVYRIVIAKGGSKLTPTTKEEQGNNTAAIGITPGAMTVVNATLSEFASLMQRYVRMDRPIVDHTGIGGKYDFKLNWTPDFSQFDGNPPGPPRNDDNAPSLYTAIQEQLGLKLEAGKEPTDALVIDHVDRPSEN